MNFIAAISFHPHLKGGRYGRDDEGRVASKISYSYPDSATPNFASTHGALDSPLQQRSSIALGFRNAGGVNFRQFFSIVKAFLGKTCLSFTLCFTLLAYYGDRER
jgi:hypothetical protein